MKERIAQILKKDRYDFYDLVEIVEILRSDVGCPWDREQTHKSIRNDLIEETYEVIEAIDREDPELMREELGDVMLQVVFHASLEKSEGRADIDGVANDICAKLIHRHPHVFGDISVAGTQEVLSNWEKIKSNEKERVTVTSRLRAVPPMLPALMRATKVGKRAKCFDFGNADEVMDKIAEEMVEVSEALENNDMPSAEEEIGDLLLSITSLCRKLDISAEEALGKATEKFIDRFEALENAVLDEGKDISELQMHELDLIWEKNKEK